MFYGINQRYFEFFECYLLKGQTQKYDIIADIFKVI